MQGKFTGLWLLKPLVDYFNGIMPLQAPKETVKILANGMEAPEANRELFVLEKIKGSWKIAR